MNGKTSHILGRFMILLMGFGGMFLVGIYAGWQVAIGSYLMLLAHYVEKHGD